jgi:membrane fusion protein (multidrug efflux system)
MSTSMPFSIRFFPGLLCLSAAVLLAGCGPSQPPAGAGGPPGGAMPAMPVTVRSVSQQTVPVLVDAVGQAEGSKEVEVRARVGGLIERQLYTEGDRVRAGAPLFAIERAPFEIALATAKAALAQEQARLEQSQREARRLKPLAEMQAIAQREADDAATAQRTAEALVAAAQARVRDAELNLSYTAVTAPIAGVSGRAEKSQGSLVSAADGLLTKVVQTDPIWVRFSFSESEMAQLKAGKGAAAVRLLGSDGQPLGGSGISGRLNFTGSSVDARLGTVGLRAAFANPEMAVLPGQFVKAQVQVGQQKAWLVPQAAVVSSEQGKMVWTVQGGKAAPTPVEVGGWFGPDWVVLKGLKDGDQVITDNLIKLRPGAAVQPKGAASAPAAAASASASASASAASR